MTLLKIGRDFLKSAIKKQRITPFRLVTAAQTQPQEIDEDLVPTPTIQKVDRTNDSTICVTFSDNTRCNFNTVWLRDSCRCPSCVHPLTQGRKIDCTNINPQIKPLSWSLRECGQLDITWPQDGNTKPHVTSFTSDWLYQFTPLFERSGSALSEAAQIEDETYCPRTSLILWNRDAFEEHIPEVDYKEFLSERPALKQVLKNVSKYGISVLRGVAPEDSEISRVAKRMGFIREIGCGQTFHIGTPSETFRHSLAKNQPNNNNLNNQAYREWSPGVQLLHCIRADSNLLKGNAAKHEFIDGFAAAQWLRHNEPDAFTVLTQTPVTFSFLDVERDRWHRETNPIITLDSRGQIKEVHYSTLSMRPPLLPTIQMSLFYNAFRLFSNRLQDKTLSFDLEMQPGDLVIFNNRRVVERGSSDLQSSADVFLKGCYMDADEILALYEKMKKDDAICEEK